MGGDGLALPEAAGVLAGVQAEAPPVPIVAGGGSPPGVVSAAPSAAIPAPAVSPASPAAPAVLYRRAGWKIALEGSGVGVLTGLVGVGGGFLIVPALVVFGRLSMRMAVGTSLLIIALKSFSGLYKYREVLHEAGLALDWRLILFFAAVGIVGSFIGNRAGAFIPQAKLKRGFAVFLVLMGAFILWQYLPAALG
jgi:uncharacterized membrane protein YfcA